MTQLISVFKTAKTIKGKPLIINGNTTSSLRLEIYTKEILYQDY